MIELRDIAFQHSASERPVLSGVSFTAVQGGITTILGPNGSGKTTLLNCISGLWRPTAGSVTCGGDDISALSIRNRARKVAVVPQEHRPPFAYTVFDVALMGRAAHLSPLSLPAKHDMEITGKTIERAGIAHLSERPYTKISGGERQLVLIARALVQEAPVLVLDEPTSHLDFRNQFRILDSLREIVRERGLTVIMTLHDPNLAMMFSDHVVLMKDGRVVDTGTPHDVINPANLRELYDFGVSVFEMNGMKIVHPWEGE